MAWDTGDMAEALPVTDESSAQGAFTEEAPEGPTYHYVAANMEKKKPQEIGWVPKQDYDYDTYNKSSKELYDEGVASGGLGPQDWASNAAKYEWNDEYGDVGPEFPELEAQLFGGEHRMRTGIEFSKIKEIGVVQESVTKIQPVRSFDDAGLHPVMLENVKHCGYDVPTPVQAYCLPAILKGHDVVACAQTGSGKTAAFLIPTLSKLMGKAKKLAAPRPNPAKFREGVDIPVRAEPLLLVVCPSRELATQIFDEARRFCYRSMLRPCVLYGGGPVKEQMVQLQKGCDVLIATPGRLCDFIDRPHVLSLQRLKYIIIDEADEMLDSSWETELKKIMSGGDQEEGNITYMMFSATFPKMARDLAKEHLANDHIRIRVGRAGSSHANIIQKVVYVEASMKRTALVDLLYANKPARTIIFVNSKRTADEVDDQLFQLDMPCTSIHSDRTQREREDALRAFRTGKCPILVATGVSARGLDVSYEVLLISEWMNIMHVVNYDLPSGQYGGIEEYIHRIGRTGRIGNIGLATSFYNDRNEDIGEELTKILLETKQEVPDFLQQYMPEEGATLKFLADSDDEGEEDAQGDDTRSAWASKTENATSQAAEVPSGIGGWSAPTAQPTALPTFAPQGPSWTPAPEVQVTAPTPGRWAESAQGLRVVPKVVQSTPMAVASGWVPPTTKPTQKVAPKVTPQAAGNVVGGWAAPTATPIAKVIPQAAGKVTGGWSAPTLAPVAPKVTPQAANNGNNSWSAVNGGSAGYDGDW